MKTYKVVYQYNKDSPIVSSSVVANLETEYKIGIVSKAKIGKLFVFKSFIMALAFVYKNNMHIKYSIYKCKSSCLERAKEICVSTSFDVVEAFWKQEMTRHPMTKPPAGTYFANEVTLIKKVYPCK